MSLCNLLIHTVSILRHPNELDSSYADIKKRADYEEIYPESVPCFIQPATSNEMFRYSQRGMRVSHKVYFDDRVSLLRNDIILYNCRDLKIVDFKNVLELDELQCVFATEDTESEQR